MFTVFGYVGENVLNEHIKALISKIHTSGGVLNQLVGITSGYSGTLQYQHFKWIESLDST